MPITITITKNCHLRRDHHLVWGRVCCWQMRRQSRIQQLLASELLSGLGTIRWGGGHIWRETLKFERRYGNSWFIFGIVIKLTTLILISTASGALQMLFFRRTMQSGTCSTGRSSCHSLLSDRSSCSTLSLAYSVGEFFFVFIFSKSLTCWQVK